MNLSSTIEITYVGGPTAIISAGGLRILSDPTFSPPGGTMRWAQAHPTKKPAHHGAGFLFSDRNGGVYFSTEPSVVICRLAAPLKGSSVRT